LQNVAAAALLLGALLLAAFAGGYLTHRLHFPRVIGYLLAGAAMRPVLSVLTDGTAAEPRADTLLGDEQPLRGVKDLALGLILFSIGRVFEARSLRSLSRSLLRVGLAEAALTAACVFAAVLLTARLTAAHLPVGTALAFALLLALGAVATAPAATLFTLNEYEAKGPVTDTLLGLVGLNNILAIVLFYSAFFLLAAGGVLHESDLNLWQAWTGIALVALASLAAGLLLGFVLSVLHAKFALSETLLVLVAAVILLAGGQHLLHARLGVAYSYLLACLVAGAIFANVAIDPDRIDQALRTAGQPLFVGFFVLAGYQLRLEELRDLHLLGAAYVLARIAGKVLGARLGLRWAGRPSDLPPGLGLGLLCQAAVIIGLADFVALHWRDPWAARSFVTTVLGSVIVFELAGPLLVKRLVVRAGEVKAVTLLRRSDAGLDRPASLARLTAEALLRLAPRSGTPRAGQPLRVRDVMRTNVRCIPAAAGFDEVLHLVEQSRYNHFPVVDEHDRLVGVMHFSDMHDVIYDPVLSDLVTAADLSDPDSSAVPVDMPLHEALRVFQAANVGSLPVIEGSGSRRVVGILEQRDVLRALRQSGGSNC